MQNLIICESYSNKVTSETFNSCTLLFFGETFDILNNLLCYREGAVAELPENYLLRRIRGLVFFERYGRRSAGSEMK
jgi:hypothetical protein